jgi:hypothetical protein
LIIALIVAVAAVFGLTAGPAAISPYGIIYFAVAVIVAVVVLYLINLVLDWVAANANMGGTWVVPVKYVLGAIVLIALLLVAANTLFGVGDTRAVRRSEPFRAEYRSVAALSGCPSPYLRSLLGASAPAGSQAGRLYSSMTCSATA